MSNLLSRSKHEEFESNLALQIRDHNERKSENATKMKHNKFWSQPVKLLLPATIRPATVHIFSTVHMHFTLLLFLLQFLVSSYFNPCNSFCFVISLAMSTI